uniref:Minor capsid protein P9 transmembrane helices domain-containing protein n=1 Tax=viral metagenome TaxID=1070528 RepID=A0A6C0B6L4_9ZZZZ
MEYLSDNLTKAKRYFYDEEEEKYKSDDDEEEQEEVIESPPKKKKHVDIPFWSDNPNILFQRQYSMEFFPIDSMTYEQKLNSVTRTVLVLTIIGLIVSQNTRIIVISGITLLAIFILHYYHKKEEVKKNQKKIALETNEGFQNPTMDFLRDQKIDVSTGALSDLFEQPDSSNPFSNVLMTDYEYNPEKKPAMPAFNSNVNQEILAQAKQLVVEANPEQPDIADKLFKDLGEQLVFEQSLRQFNSNPSTTIPNDQGAFADFCYGSMVSCKEGNDFACARNFSRYTNT